MRALLSAITVLFLTLQCQAGTRVAIVSDKGNKVIDLAIAELSAADGIELLDRSEINRILKEQGLSVLSLDPWQVPSVSRLLKSDLFAVLEADRNGDAVGLVVFSAATGLRLISTALPAGDVENTARFTAESIKQAQAKLMNSQDGGLKYLSLISVRNVDMPRDVDPVCRAVGVLLMQAMANSKDIAVLERRHLEYLNKERSLPGIDVQNDLLASTVAMDLEIARHNDEYIATILLPKGEKITAISADLDPAGIAGIMANKLLGRFSRGSFPAKLDIGNEGRRLKNEYRFMEGHRKYAEAHEKIEACYALQPDADCSDLVESLRRMAGLQSKDEAGIKLSMDFIDRALSLADMRHASKEPYAFGTFENYRSTYIKEAVVSDETRSRMHDFQQSILKYNIKVIRNAHGFDAGQECKINDYRSYKKYERFLERLYHEYTVLLPEQCLTEFIPLCEKWIDLTARYSEMPFVNGCSTHYSPHGFLLGVICQGAASQMFRSKIDYICKGLLKHPVPSLRIAGKYGLLLAGGHQKNAGDFYWKECRDSVFEAAKAEIEMLGQGNQQAVKKTMCYELLIPSYPGPRTDSPAARLVNIQPAFEFMTERHELRSSITYEIITAYMFYLAEKSKKAGGGRPDRASCEEAVRCGRRVIDLCDSPETVILCYGGKAYEKLYADRAKESAIDLLNYVYKYWPDLKIEAEGLPWKADLCVIRDLDTSIPPINYNEHIYGIRFVRSEPSQACLMKITVPSGTAEQICRQAVDWKEEDRFQFNLNTHHTLIKNNLYMWGSCSHGLLVFPLSPDSAPFRIDKDAGLPSNYIQSFTCLGNLIIMAVGLEDSYIYTYNLETKVLTLVSSSARKTRKNPFDNLNKPVLITGMVADEQKSRAVMLSGGVNIPPGLSGLWSYNIKTEEWVKLPGTEMFDDGVMSERNGKILISDAWSDYCYEYNIADDSIRLLYRFWEKDGDHRAAFTKLNGLPIRYRPPYLLTDDHLWSGGNRLFRMSLTEGKIEDLPCFGKYSRYKYMNMTLDGKYLLAGDDKNLWALELHVNAK